MPKTKKKPKKRKGPHNGPPVYPSACPDCGQPGKHTHCNECGSTTHGAAYCDSYD